MFTDQAPLFGHADRDLTPRNCIALSEKILAIALLPGGWTTRLEIFRGRRLIAHVLQMSACAVLSAGCCRSRCGDEFHCSPYAIPPFLSGHRQGP